MVLASIRKITGKKKLKKLTIKNAAPVAFHQIKTVGIIYYLDTAADVKTITKILKNPFFEGKHVQTICWLRATKKIPHPVVEGITFMERADFDTKFMPSSKNTRYFCNEEFDLLIDLTSDYHFPLHALSVMSNAKLKAGQSHKLNWHLQVGIKLPEPKKGNTPYLLEQITSYLEKLFP